MSSWLHFALVAVLGLGVRAERGCPPPEDIEPCVCIDSPSPRLTCHNLLEVEVLRQVFKNSERYFYHEVWIRSSTLGYIPSEEFEKIKVGELFIVNSTLQAIFNRPPKSDFLYKIHVEDTDFKKVGFFALDNLKNLTSLRTIVINNYRMIRISDGLGSTLPSSVRQITFNDTSIRRIFPGAFEGLENLDKLAVQFSKLRNLTRDIFPQPFNIRFLYLDHNKIESVSSDMFTEMPNLQFLTLRNNSLFTLPETAFGGRPSNVPYIGLEGNPLDCNCLLVWLVKDKPEIIDGTCSKPNKLQGKSLQNLSPADFNC